jgi:hypothetical protein
LSTQGLFYPVADNRNMWSWHLCVKTSWWAQRGFPLCGGHRIYLKLSPKMFYKGKTYNRYHFMHPNVLHVNV